MSKLKVDLELHRKMGMTVLTEEQARSRRTEVFMPWPKGDAVSSQGGNLGRSTGCHGKVSGQENLLAVSKEVAVVLLQCHG